MTTPVTPTPTVFARGFRYPEGPAFDASGDLFVVELGGSRVSRITPDGTSSTFAEVEGSPTGAAFGPAGALSVCNNGGRHPAAPSTDGIAGEGGAPEAIQRIAQDASVSTVVDAIDGSPLNAPNDICFDASGGFWFSDPSWVFADDGMAGPGTICYTAADGKTTRAHTGLRFPNGVGLTADGSQLLVTESSTGDVWVLPVEGPGSLGAPVRFGSTGDGGLPDGLAVDVDGRVLVAGHGTDSIHVLGPDGRTEQQVPLGAGSGPSNLCFGGPDHSTVYVTAANTGEVLTFPWSCPGLVLPG